MYSRYIKSVPQVGSLKVRQALGIAWEREPLGAYELLTHLRYSGWHRRLQTRRKMRAVDSEAFSGFERALKVSWDKILSPE